MDQDRPGKKLWDKAAWRDAAFFWKYLKPHRGVFIAAMVALVATAGMMLIFFRELGDWIGYALNGAKGQELIDRSNRSAVFLVGLVALQAFIAFWRILLFAKASERALASLRRETFSRIIRLPMATLGARRVGELASRLANDVESMRETLVVTIPQAIRHSVILVGGTVVVFFLSVKLALFMMATIPVVLVLIAVFGTRIRKLTRKAQDDLAASQVVVDESLQGIISVKAFCNEAYEIARYDRRLGSYLGAAIKAALPRASFIAFIIFCFSVALVGPSGSGKTTTVSLLFRFYEPTKGRILFDGKPAGAMPLQTLRKNLALVPQEVLLFGDSIRENIAYGRPGASDEEIREAARQANAHEFIEKLPNGYETQVGDRGTQLSGGQRQRIAIARAILADPAILILDEATSSLDAESERLVQGALDKLMENRTSIIIAHRLSTVRRCDQILVLSAGTVVERGTHEELVANAGSLYATLARLQLE
jgi:ABC-type multidrug transport system fused ATPase/permease subunit